MTTINGIDKIIYGVADMDTSKRFFTDWGLTLNQARSTHDQVLFETLDGTEIELRAQDAANLPPPFEAGSTLREVIWGVDDSAALERLSGQLAAVTRIETSDDNQIRCTDPNGMGLSFRVGRRHPVDVRGTPVNTYDRPQARVNQRSMQYERAQPVKVGHVVFFTPNLADTEAFYRDGLGFVVSDRYPGRGVFLRCRPEGGHHNLFLLQTPDGKRGLNHVAFTVRDLHEVFGGGLHISRCGWKTQIGPGRHPISSAYFWYVQNPCGGLAEYYSDEDYLTADWQPKEDWQQAPENFAEWAVNGGLDGNTRRQYLPE
jgi:catechol 2,3-dioxygenase-like lactoylglutathione lyase family enzyme